MQRWRLMIATISALRDIQVCDRDSDTFKQLIDMGINGGKSPMERMAASFAVYVYTGEPAHDVDARMVPFDAIEVAARGDRSFRRMVADFVNDPFWP
ncbi:MAG: hypothetical protein AAF958_01355 [Planctomycetota bacterium]